MGVLRGCEGAADRQSGHADASTKGLGGGGQPARHGRPLERDMEPPWKALRKPGAPVSVFRLAGRGQVQLQPRAPVRAQQSATVRDCLKLNSPDFLSSTQKAAQS